MTRPVSPEVRAAAVAAYLTGESSGALGRRYGVSGGTITGWVKRAGHRTHQPGGGLPVPRREREPVEEAVWQKALAQYAAGVGLTAIAREAGVSVGVLRAWAKAAGTPRHRQGRSRAAMVSPAQQEAAVREYLAGWPVSRIAAVAGVSSQRVLHWVTQAGHPLRPSSQHPVAVREAAIADYLAGMSGAAVAERYEITSMTVLKWVRDAGHTPRRGQELSPQRAAVADYLDGYSAAEAATRRGVAPRAVLAWVRAAGYTTRPRGLANARQVAVNDYLSGASVVQLGAKFGVPAKRVRAWLHDAGQELQPGRRPGADADR